MLYLAFMIVGSYLARADILTKYLEQARSEVGKDSLCNFEYGECEGINSIWGTDVSQT
jgi:hypothetical protein